MCGVNEFVSVRFQPLALFVAELPFRSAAEQAAAVLPVVWRSLKADIAAHVVERRHGIDAVWVLAAIETAAGQQAGQLRNGDAE